MSLEGMMATQLGLELRAERKRLSDQCSLILGRLMQGMVTNDELSRISRKYTGRISDLRKRGHDIRCVKQNRATGLSYYCLFIEGAYWHGGRSWTA